TNHTVLTKETESPGGALEASAARLPAFVAGRRRREPDVDGRGDDGDDRDRRDAEDGEPGRADQPRALAVASGIAAGRDGRPGRCRKRRRDEGAGCWPDGCDRRKRGGDGRP